jgi:hypothetical protein
VPGVVGGVVAERPGLQLLRHPSAELLPDPVGLLGVGEPGSVQGEGHAHGEDAGVGSGTGAGSTSWAGHGGKCAPPGVTAASGRGVAASTPLEVPG